MVDVSAMLRIGQLSKWGVSRAYVFWTLVITLAVEAFLASLLLIPDITIDKKLGISLFAIVPAFVITIVQLMRTQQIQRAGYIKDFLTEFRKNPDLYSAFYDLIYRYRDGVYDRIDEIGKNYLKERSIESVPAEEKPLFEPFDALQVSKEPGSRFFHPLFFQFSPEEKKLDGLLDHLNTIGLYLREGLIHDEDVVSMLGDYLAVIANRKIVKEYLKVCEEKWKYRDAPDSVGASPPYKHLNFLLVSYELQNLKEVERRRTEELNREINRRKREIEDRKRRR